MVTSPPFERIRRPNSVPQEVLAHLLEAVKDGRLSPGDRLPSERALTHLLGVGRPALREALGGLSLLGLVQTTQGRGTFLSPSLAAMPHEPYLFQLLLNRGKLSEFMEIRMIIEPEIAGMAARRATEASRTALAAAFETYERAVSSGSSVDNEAEAGGDFHQALAAASGNATLASLLKGLGDLLEQTGKTILADSPGASHDAHAAIYEAVLQRKSALARNLMVKHLNEVHRALWVSWSGKDDSATEV